MGGQEGSLAPHTPCLAQTGCGQSSPDMPPSWVYLWPVTKLRGCKWLSPNNRVLSWSHSSHCWQSSRGKKPEAERRIGLQGPVPVWGEGGDTWPPPPRGPSWLSVGAEASPQPYSCASPDSKTAAISLLQMPAVREEGALQAGVSRSDSSPPRPNMWGLPGLLP